MVTVMTEMKVFGLALDEQSQAPVLVLKDLAEDKVLPIWIGAMEAMAISLAINEVALPRPMTHDLLLLAVRGLGWEVRRVDVTRLEEGTYFAEIEMAQPGPGGPEGKEEVRRIDARPSDAIALALRAKAPIFVSLAILEEVSAQGVAASTPVITTEDAEKWTELLEQFSDDETKYKM